jgi:uncharacterized protein (TIGR02996 family)
MSDRDALLAAICAHPAEDTPRLAFADWLDEHADTLPTPAVARQRAAFIRDDVAMARRDEYDPPRLRWELIEKPQREADGWVRATVPPELRTPYRAGDRSFRRGFPWCIQFTPGQLLAHAGILEQVPAGTLSYGAADGAADELFRSPHFARLAGLRARLRPASVQTLVESPYATALEELTAGPSGLAYPAVPVLVRSALFPRLARLDLSGHPGLGPALVAHLHYATGPLRLGELRLASSGLLERHVEQLLDAPAVRGLARLSLASCWLGLAGCEAVARADLVRLAELDLSATGPGAEGFRALMSCAPLSRLRRLGFRNNHVNGSLVAEFATCRETSNLRILDLTSNAIGNAGAAALARSPHLAELSVVYLSHCMVGDEGVNAVLESPLADGLVLLDLTGSPASAEMKAAVKGRMGDRVRL